MNRRLLNRRRTDERRLMQAAVAVCGAALLISAIALIAVQFLSLRKSMRDDLSALGEIVGANSAAALMFNDPVAATETLDALLRLPHIEAAAIYSESGKRMAFLHHGSVTLPERADTDLLAGGYRYGMRRIDIARRIHFKDQEVGQVRITASLHPLYVHLLIHAALTLLIGMLALLATLPLISRLRAQIVSAQQHLDQLAHVDAVTGLANRRAFNQCLRTSLDSTPSQPAPIVGLMLLDLDDFKLVNDTLGHDIGDQLLTSVGDRLKRITRSCDLVCRLGGDEFAIVLPAPDAGLQQLQRIAERILVELSSKFTLGGSDAYVGVSIGISCSPDNGSDAETLTRSADAAMYEAKRHGKNTWRVFSEQMNQRAHQRTRLESDLRQALHNGEFMLEYQPQLDLVTQRIAAAEVLLRWQSPERGLVASADFMPIAEECGLIVPIGRWLLEAACRDAAGWRNAGLGEIQLSLNLSKRQLHNVDLVDDVVHALQQSGLPPELLELEMSEAMLMQDIESTTKVLARLHELGIGLAIGDFGTGHASLSQLASLPLSHLKMDLSLMPHIPGKDEAVVDAILSLARSLQFGVVAAGVETLAQHRYLAQRGWQRVQGDLIARAMPNAAFADYLYASHQELTSRPVVSLG